jgi:hypothetical protein
MKSNISNDEMKKSDCQCPYKFNKESNLIEFDDTVSSPNY